MINETCPYCGAVQSDLQYDEELDWGDDRIEESLTCLRNQIAAQIAEIERLKTASATMAGMVLKEIQDEREACSDIADQLGTFGYDGHKIAKAIRARGEVK